MIGHQPSVVERHRRLVRQRLQKVDLVTVEVALLIGRDGEPTDEAIADEERHADEAAQPLGADQARVDGARVGEDVGHHERRSIGSDPTDEPFAETQARRPRPRAGRRAQRQRLAVGLDQPQPRHLRPEDVARGVHDALQELVGRHARRQPLRHLRQQIEPARLRAALRGETGARDGQSDLMRDALQEDELVAVEAAASARQQRQHAPRHAVEHDGQRDLPREPGTRGAVVAADVGHVMPAATDNLAQGRADERPRVERRASVGREAVAGHEHEALAGLIGTVQERDVDARDRTDDAERPRGRRRQIGAARHRHRRGVERLDADLRTLADRHPQAAAGHPRPRHQQSEERNEAAREHGGQSP